MAGRTREAKELGERVGICAAVSEAVLRRLVVVLTMNTNLWQCKEQINHAMLEFVLGSAKGISGIQPDKTLWSKEGSLG